MYMFGCSSAIDGLQMYWMHSTFKRAGTSSLWYANATLELVASAVLSGVVTRYQSNISDQRGSTICRLPHNGIVIGVPLNRLSIWFVMALTIWTKCGGLI